MASHSPITPDTIQAVRALDGDIAAMIARGGFLFVGAFVFFVDNDQPEIRQGGEDGRAGADDDAGFFL